MKYIFLILLIFHASLSQADVQTGLENLLENHLHEISNKRIGLIANHTSCDSEGNHILDLLSKHAKITAIFALEHGFRGNVEAGKHINDQTQQDYEVFSLYGETKAPTSEMLKNVDLLIYDVQDVGVRFYTYISSLYLAMQSAKKHNVPVLVLDRPNPICADVVQGPVADPGFFSFVGIAPLPIRYGMTVGELAQWFNQEAIQGDSIHCDLTVIPMKDYQRSMNYNETGLPWIAPSPNMPTLETAFLYPGMCLIEGTNLAEGRGTDSPFLTIGSPYINADEWLRAIPQNVSEGVEIETISFTPISIPGKSTNPKYKNELCNGLRFHITDYKKLKPIPLAVELIKAAQLLHPKEFEFRTFIDKLWGSDTLRVRIKTNHTFQYPNPTHISQLNQFQQSREKYLLY